jgi:hypothetical protein
MSSYHSGKPHFHANFSFADARYRESLDLLAARQKDQFTEFQTAMTATLTEAIRDQGSKLPRWPAAMDWALGSLDANTSTHGADHSSPGVSQERRAGFLINEYAHIFAAKLAESETTAWKSLSYPVIMDREDAIEPAELCTFDWIFEKPRSQERPWSSFLDWLYSGESLYWIQGKAGSGKSTLVKHLLNHKRSHRALREWAGDTPSVDASFFFWYTGNELQKSQIGLLRALLYQCLTDYRELIPIVLADTTRVKTTDLPQH